MTAYAGDFPASHTAVCIPFDSFAASTGAPSAVTNFAAADVLIYKNGGTTQRTSASGITVTTSFDAQTGLQMIVIDTSDNTDAGFYAAGNEYQVAVADITIDSQTVRFWAGTFSIERAGGVLALLKATGSVKVDVVKWNSTTVATPATAGIPDVNTKNINNVAAATPGASGGVLISGANTGTTTLGALTVTGAATISGGVVVTQSTLNTDAIKATGNGTGAGMRLEGGSGGIGLAAVSSGSASAVKFAALGTNAIGLEVVGVGSGQGMKATAGSTGIGLNVVGGATSGDGMTVSHTGVSNFDINASIHGTIDTVTTATNVTTVNGLAANVITATSINTGAITSAKFAAGAIDAAAIATDAIDADAIAASAVTEIQNGLATPTNITAGTITTATNVTTVNGLAAGVITATSIAANAITAAKIATDAIGAAQLAADAVTEIQSGLATSAALATVQADTDDIQTRLPAALTVGGNIKADALAISGDTVAADNAESFFDGTGYAGTNNVIPTVTLVTTVTNLTNAPTAGDLTAVMKASVTTAATAATPTAAAVTGNVGGNVAGSVASVTGDIGGLAAGAVTDVENAVWDAVLASHLTAGSTGAALNAATVAGSDPWNTSLPGAYAAGKAGYILGTYLDAAITSRLAAAGYTAPLDAAGTRAAVGLASANLDTQIGDLPTNAELAAALAASDDAVLAAVAALNNLSQADVRTAIGMGSADMDSQLGTIAAALALVKIKTDQLQFSNANKVDASILAVADLAAAVANKIADHAARRTSENIEASSDGDTVQFRSLYGAIAKLTNKVTIVGGTLTVKKADDSANLGFQTTTGTAGADPITAVDTT